MFLAQQNVNRNIGYSCTAYSVRTSITHIFFRSNNTWPLATYMLRARQLARQSHYVAARSGDKKITGKKYKIEKIEEDNTN